jgi:hypothetical protein
LNNEGNARCRALVVEDHVELASTTTATHGELDERPADATETMTTTARAEVEAGHGTTLAAEDDGVV